MIFISWGFVENLSALFQLKSLSQLDNTLSLKQWWAILTVPGFNGPTTGPSRNYMHINPLRAKFFRGNMNIYLHFVSFLHIDMTQVPKILPQVREGPTYSI